MINYLAYEMSQNCEKCLDQDPAPRVGLTKDMPVIMEAGTSGCLTNLKQSITY